MSKNDSEKSLDAESIEDIGKLIGYIIRKWSVKNGNIYRLI